MQDVRKFNIWMIISGVLLTIIGILFMFWQTAGLATIALVVGIGFIICGIGEIATYANYHGSAGVNGWVIVFAVMDLLLGILFVFNPLLMASVIPWVIGVFVIIAGVGEIVASFYARSGLIFGWWGLIASGVITVLFGMLMIAYPGILAVLIGIYALVRGVSLIAAGATFNQLVGH